MPDLQVLIIGAGLGGLSLAQSLRQAGVGVRIFERDPSPWDRPQGYRLHLDADAIGAAHEVLTPQLHAVFEATSQRTEPFTTILGTDLSVAKRLPTHDDHGEGVWPERDGAPKHCNVDRATLRQILLAGLDGVVEYGRKLARYESRDDGVVAHFEDGGTAEGHVLVGADGVRSAVRLQRAPGCRTADAGLQAIYGRVPWNDARGLVPDETLRDIFTIAIDERKLFLGLGSVRFPTRPELAARGNVELKAQDDYVVCIVGGRPELMPSPQDVLHAAGSSALQEIAAEAVEGWPGGAAARVIRRGDPGSFFLVDMYTSLPCTLEPPTNVTLLGDAIHAMTPTLGRGANLAMRDGALLGRALRAAARGEQPLADALLGYERGMTSYGFAVVREAARIGQQRVGQKPLPT